MSTFTDEQLSAFLDNELGPEERAALAEALVDDAELAARLDALRGGDAAFEQALSSIDDRPLPDGLEALLDAADADEVQEPAAPVAASMASNDNSPWRAIAASVALVAAFTAGSLIAPFGGGDDTLQQLASLASDPAVQSMLDESPSGERVTLSSGQAAEARLSFVGTSGDYCREFTVSDASGSTVAVACKPRDEDWQVLLAASGPALGDAGDGYSTASDSNAAFDAAVTSLMASDSADAETETIWIEGGWISKP